ncbi:uncharacterized protein LOC129612681 [Condylostylus longicornis]|uniref:uncharacterized protein LOC129612681 n=1 Tax=Condylostylus longicornis TaxID=2530218 RepID=UPI00244DDA3F|nr:uncharacterized protein LOC129612681 [Condylostylus longicornis]
MNNTTPKWAPKHSNDIIKLFGKTKEIEFELKFLAKKFSTDINLDLLDFYEFSQIIEECRRALILSETIQESLRNQIVPATSKKLQRSAYKSLLQKKAILMVEGLQRRHYQLMFVINKTIKYLLDISTQSDITMEAALNLSTLLNETIETCLQTSNGTSSSGSKICSNTFPVLLLLPKKIEIGLILQILCKSRAEHCSMALISCLLETSKIELFMTTEDTESCNSSVEVLKTLTSHLSIAVEKYKDPFHYHLSPNQKNFTNAVSNEIDQNQEATTSENYTEKQNESNDSNKCEQTAIENDPAIKFFDEMAKELLEKTKRGTDEERCVIKCDILQHLITDEEAFIAYVISKCCKTCPLAIDELSRTNLDYRKWISRGVRSLWTQIGSTLDHIVLWWSNAALACRPAECTKQLRDWLLLLQPQDAPEPVLSTLKGLGETLTTHVTNTIWDQQFRLALVASSLTNDVEFEKFANFKVYTPGTISGNLWCEVLNSLTSLCNSCDSNGTIPNQLPIVEQIPILHRLDHTVHSVRIWVLGRAKFLCSEWNMTMFFLLHGDVKNCLDNLQELRVPQLAAADLLEVLIQVCVALRWKLVSEIKVNIQKLKEAAGACVEILSHVCKTYSLATLTLCFPSTRHWQTEVLQSECDEYVTYFLNKVFLPICKACKDLEILQLTLKLICEAWLDHIYRKRIRFSTCGAVNLLKDFDGVSEWIITCPSILNEHVDRLSRHEVLKMCEGVGKILLRKPEEIMSILPSPKFRKQDDDNADENTQLPPEMFVPNQKRWLELRVRNNRKFKCFCLCSGISVEN